MAKITVLPGRRTISGFKGKLDFYVHDGQPCVRRWPRSPGHRRAPAVEAQWAAFAYAAALWGSLSPEVQAAYNKMASGTGLSGRDTFTRSYLSGLYTYPTGGEEEMKMNWFDAAPEVLTDLNRTATLGWTPLDLSGHVSATAKFVYLQIHTSPDVIGGAPSQCFVGLKKAGTTPPIPYYHEHVPGEAQVGYGKWRRFLIALDASKRIEYTINIGAGWRLDTHLYLFAEVIE